MRNWLKLFAKPHQEQKTKEKVYSKDIIGYAVLHQSGLTGKKMWVSWDNEGLNEVLFKEDEPLVFPPEGLQVGTRVRLLLPEK